MIRQTQQSESLGATKAARASEIRIEHSGNQGVIIIKDYPSSQRRKGMKVLVIIGPILCSIPLIIWVMYRRGVVNLFVLLAAAFFVVTILSTLIRQFTIKTRSYILRADHVGLTIEMTTWRRQSTRYLVRGQIADIVIDCSGGGDPRNSIFKSWLVIKSSSNGEIRCLYDIGGDQLARAANALRAALRMPTRTWP